MLKLLNKALSSLFGYELVASTSIEELSDLTWAFALEMEGFVTNGVPRGSRFALADALRRRVDALVDAIYGDSELSDLDVVIPSHVRDQAVKLGVLAATAADWFGELVPRP